MREDKYFSILNNNVLKKFLSYFRISANEISKTELLNKLCLAFSFIPYENLTKIIKADQVISPATAKRGPDEVIREFLESGTGGTCFSLTATFTAILNKLGFTCFPILADRHYGPDTHCALVIKDNSQNLLLDPGFLIYRPVPIPSLDSVSYDNGHNKIRLLAHPGGQRVELLTETRGNIRSRLTYKMQPVDYNDFITAWERTFSWEMMNYPVLTSLSKGKHLYLQDNIIRTRDHDQTTKEILKIEGSIDTINILFGLNREVIKRALRVISYGKYQ